MHNSDDTNTPKKNIQDIDFRLVWKYLRLIVCFPLGLFVMWTQAPWSRAVKTAISSAVALILIVLLLPITNPPEREIGGIQLVEQQPQEDLQGPAAPANREAIEIYAPRYTSILLEATATPQAIIVYCNNGGKYYHTNKCRYYRITTPPATLEQAIAAGYSQCPDCDAPSPYQ